MPVCVHMHTPVHMFRGHCNNVFILSIPVYMETELRILEAPLTSAMWYNSTKQLRIKNELRD